jgi:fatty acid desaturase
MQTKLARQLSIADGRRYFRSLQEELAAHGFFKPRHLAIAVRLTVLCSLLAFSLWMVWAPAASTLWMIFGIFLLSLVMAQFAFLGHDAAHGALTHHKSIINPLGQFCMTVVNGLCFQEWRFRHVTHHLYCQHEAKDPDMGDSPFASVTKDAAVKKKGLALFLTRIQPVTIWFFTLGFGHSLRLLGQLGALQNARKYQWDILTLALHYGLWIALPLFVLDVSLSQVLIVYFAPLFILGPYLAGIFWVNHLGMPLVETPAEFSFFEHQVRTTRNIRPLPGTAWFYGGLCYQIEHHLFPSIPSYELGAATKFTRKKIAEAGMSYEEEGWSSAVYSVGKHFHEVSRV